MRLTNREVVTLVKALAIHAHNNLHAGTSDLQREVDALLKKGEDWLADPQFPGLGGVCIDLGDLFYGGEGVTIPGGYTEAEYEEIHDEEDDEDKAAGEEAPAEAHCEECEECGESEVPSSEDGDGAPEVADEGEEPLRSDFDLTAGQLFNLPGVKTTLGKARFLGDGDAVNFDIYGGDVVIEDVTHLKRFAKALHLLDGYGEWHIVEVNKWPKLWTKRVPVKQLAEIVS